MIDTTFSTRDGRLWTARFNTVTEEAALEQLGVRLADLAEFRPSELMKAQRKPSF